MAVGTETTKPSSTKPSERYLFTYTSLKGCDALQFTTPVPWTKRQEKREIREQMKVFLILAASREGGAHVHPWPAVAGSNIMRRTWAPSRASASSPFPRQID